MAFQRNGYYYDKQITSYLLQFMAIFSGLQVQVGRWNDSESELYITVPIHYGDADRVVSSIIANNTQNAPVRLPIMSASIRGLDVALDRMHGTGVERRHTFVPVGGLVPDDIKVIHQRQSTPYNMEVELAIWVSNNDQHFQILEQIMPLFDPQLNIQTSDALFDMGRLTSVELKSGPTIETNYPSGTERRLIRSTMIFNVPIVISSPADVKRDFVEKIFMRVSAVNTDASTEDIVSIFDAENIPYELVVSDETLPFS